METLIATCIGIGFIGGVVFSEFRAKRKHDRRHKRRQMIIQKRDNIVDEISRWEVDHPQRVLLLPERCASATTMKGIGRMPTEAFGQLCRSMKEVRVGFKDFSETIRRFIDGQA